MCNCNQQRAAYSAATAQPQKGAVKVKLTRNSPLVLNGNITGRTYEFKKINDINWVDRRDMISMNGIAGLQVFY
jgi:hypothetical protein